MGNGELNDSFLDINKHVINFASNKVIFIVLIGCIIVLMVPPFSIFRRSASGRWLESDLHASSIKEE